MPVDDVKSPETISVMRRALVDYKVELGRKHLSPIIKFTHLDRGVHCKIRYEVHGVIQPHPHHMLINRSNPNNRKLELSINCCNSFSETGTIALAKPVVGITPNANLSIPWSLHYQPPELS